jgi:hypothetical protein
MPTGYVNDEIYQQHDTRDHVEGKDRLTAIDAVLEKTKLKEQLVLIPPRAATIDEIAAVHDHEYIRSLKAEIDSGGGWLDPDTYASPGSWNAALYAAGLMNAVDRVMKKAVDNAFALVRPRDITPYAPTRWALPLQQRRSGCQVCPGPMISAHTHHRFRRPSRQRYTGSVLYRFPGHVFLHP